MSVMNLATFWGLVDLQNLHSKGPHCLCCLNTVPVRVFTVRTLFFKADYFRFDNFNRYTVRSFLFYFAVNTVVVDQKTTEIEWN